MEKVKLLDPPQASSDSGFTRAPPQPSTSKSRRGGSAESWDGGSWGVQRTGTEKDRDDLNRIITKELRKTGNRGESFFVTNFSLSVLIVDIQGLDEELAEAVDRDFYEHYDTWKMDHPSASTKQQVNFPIKTSLHDDSKTKSGPSVDRGVECSSRR